MATYQHPTGGKKPKIPYAAIRKDQANRLAWGKKNTDREHLLMKMADGTLRRVTNPYYVKPAAPTTPGPAKTPAAPPSGGPVDAEPYRPFPATPPASSGTSDIALPDYDTSGIASALGSSTSDSLSGIDLSSIFKPPAALNVSQLMAPTTRLLDQQRADIQAARDKASDDLKAFNDYLARSQSATQQGLGQQLTSIAGDAIANRASSLANVARLTQGAVAAAGGNADLLNAGGMTAALQGQSFLQNAQDAANEQVANTQATLAARQADQNRVSNALSAGLPLELARQYNASMGDLRDRELAVTDKASQLRAQDILSQRDYASNQAAQAIAAWTAQAEYAGKNKDRAVKVLTEQERERTKRMVATINNQVRREIEQGKITQRQAEARQRALISKLDRESRENIATYTQEAIAQRSGVKAKINQKLDNLAAGEAPQSTDMIGFDSQQKLDMVRKAAIRFVNRARNQYGRGAVPWSVINSLLETHFPTVSEDPQLGKQLKAIWGG
jgi:hypothetical protein